MLAARTVLRGVDALVWGDASPSAVRVTAVDIGAERVGLSALTEDETRLAQEALADAWERACWAPLVKVRPRGQRRSRAA